MRESWSIKIQKDYLKFSAAHFLIFPDGSAERLHGHNYKVFVELHTPLDEHGLVVNFKEIKPLIRSLVDELDEPLPDLGEFEEGYALWREAFEADEAGFFLMPVADIVQHVEDVLCGLEESG